MTAWALRASALGVLALLLGCGGSVELLDHLDRARITSTAAHPVRRAVVTVKEQHRISLRADADTEVRFEKLLLKRGQALRFGIGIDEAAWREDGDGVLFQVRWEANTTDSVVFSRYIDPKARAEDRRWIDALVPLDSLVPAGAETVEGTLTFVTSAGMRSDPTADHAGWSRPKLVSAVSAPAPTADERPNVLLISLDTLRADRLGIYGAQPSVTPHIDAWAREAMVFDQALAPANSTLETHMSVLTGLAPEVHGVRTAAHSPKRKQFTSLDPRRITLAEMLQGAGYATAAFVQSCFWLNREFGFAQGFDTYHTSVLHAAARNQNEVFRWLERHREQPFFLFVHYFDIHSDWQRLPYDVPREYSARFLPPESPTFTGCAQHKCATRHLVRLDAEGEVVSDDDLAYIRSLYDAGVAFTDTQIGALLGAMKQLGLYDRTLIVLMSDHGEEFRDHGRFLHSQLYEEIIHVPLIMSYPPAVAAGRRVSTPTALLDLMATILEITGGEPSGDLQGHSLLPVVSGTAEPRPLPVLSTGSGLYAVRQGNWKLIVSPKTHTRELYDLNADPGERHNLATQQPAISNRLAATIYAWVQANRTLREAIARAAAEKRPQAVDLSDADVERLRHLGYVAE